jgi:hypothetical protein
VLDALIHREDRQIPGAGEAPGAEDLLEIAQYGDRSITVDKHPIDKIRSGQVHLGSGDALALVAEQGLGIIAEQVVQIHGFGLLGLGGRLVGHFVLLG